MARLTELRGKREELVTMMNGIMGELDIASGPEKLVLEARLYSVLDKIGKLDTLIKGGGKYDMDQIYQNFYEQFRKNIIYIDFKDQARIFEKIHFELKHGASLILIQNGHKMQAENFIRLCKARYLTTAQNIAPILFEVFDEVSPQEYLSRLKAEVQALDLSGPLDEQAKVIAGKLFERASDGQVLLLEIFVTATINKEFMTWYQDVFWQKMLDAQKQFPARKVIAFVIAEEIIETSQLPEILHKKIEEFAVDAFFEFELGIWDEEVLSNWFDNKLNLHEFIDQNIALKPENRVELIKLIKFRAQQGTDWIPKNICDNIKELPDRIIERIRQYDVEKPSI